LIGIRLFLRKNLPIKHIRNGLYFISAQNDAASKNIIEPVLVAKFITHDSIYIKFSLKAIF